MKILVIKIFQIHVKSLNFGRRSERIENSESWGKLEGSDNHSLDRLQREVVFSSRCFLFCKSHYFVRKNMKI